MLRYVLKWLHNCEPVKWNGEKRIKGICHHSTIEFSANFNLWWISIKSLHWKWGFSIIIWILFYIFFFLFFWQRTSWIYGCRVFGTLVGGEVSPQKTGRESTVHNRAKKIMWPYLKLPTHLCTNIRVEGTLIGVSEMHIFNFPSRRVPIKV